MDGFTSHVLPRERAGASFDVTALREVVTKGRDKDIAKFAKLFAGPPFDDQDDDVTLSYEDGFKKKIERVAAAFEIARSNPAFMAAHMKQKVAMEDFFEHNGIYLHFTMMLAYLQAQGTPEQQKYWNRKAREGGFIAAYAQTELGHGSNVRGLETMATFDSATKEFEIHSPTLTSLKWWPTGMYACTHALVFAQLIIGSKNYGFHGFMVQLRRDDGGPMDGVEIGEIGPKLNGTSNNIGYCRFTRVRIPMDRLFSKHSKVTLEGEYVAAPRNLSKLSYISMMLARTSIVGIAYKECAKAVTIAVRYSAIRKQGFKDSTGDAGIEKGEEHAVLDYQMQRYRTFKALSLAYCLLWSSRFLSKYIRRVQEAIQGGDEKAADDLPELHATLSGLKAHSTVKAHMSIEDCRKCCGGQGFLLSSGIAKIAPDFSEWVTVEGEQVILSLQCARFLIKAVRDASAGKPLTATVAYIGEADKPLDISTPEGVIEAMKGRARRVAKRLTAQFEAAQKRGLDFDKALNSVASVAYRAAEAHVDAFMLVNNKLAIHDFFDKSPKVLRVMLLLLELQGLQTISERAGDWVGSITPEVLEQVDARVATLLDAIRPDAVSLVDAFGFSDTQLKSTLGKYDGNVYEAIYARAAANPLNKTKRMVGWDRYSQVLDLDFLRDSARAQHQAPAAGASKL